MCADRVAGEVVECFYGFVLGVLARGVWWEFPGEASDGAASGAGGECGEGADWVGAVGITLQLAGALRCFFLRGPPVGGVLPDREGDDRGDHCHPDDDGHGSPSWILAWMSPSL